ncbi:MAG: hypothetical protein EOP80_04160 [Variovorax sp.]|nr:MAG: hypothetical protein EOP80_04160 [Variovorax sp.]
MTRAHRWTVGVLGTLVLLLLAGAAALAWWLPSEAELATRLQNEFQQRSGIGLKVGRVHWALRPVPVVVVEGIATVQERPITARRVALTPQLGALLWQRRIAFDDLEVDGAVLPRVSVRAFRGRGDNARAPAADGWSLAPVPLRQARFTDVTWVDRRDIALAYDGTIEFDAGWRPRRAEVVRRGVTPTARAVLAREGDADRWRTDIEVGGGTWRGVSVLETPDSGALRFSAQLAATNVDVAQLTAAFQRRSAVDGRLSGQTELRSEGADPGELVRKLHSRTRFSVRPARLLRFDLAKAVTTAGISRDGQTPLDELTGTLDTQATEDGVVLRYSDLKARSGLLTASGSATVMNRKLNGEVAVDLVDGVVGVPLKIGGTLDAPELSLTGGALAGAAVGSAVLPGVGTAIGARIGQKMEKLFGGDRKLPPPRRPRTP